MLLEVIFASKSLLAKDTRVRPNASVNSFVSRQFLISSEPFPAGLNVTLERSFTCRNEILYICSVKMIIHICLNLFGWYPKIIADIFLKYKLEG